MRFFRLIVSAVACGSLSAGLGRSQPADIPPIADKPYSVEVMVVPDGGVATPETIKVFVNGQKTRFEITEGDAASPTVEITREDLQKIYLQAPGAKAKEFALTDKTRDGLIFIAHLAQGKFKDLGTERPDRHLYLVTLKNNSIVCLWFNPFTHEPVKLADSGVTVLFRNFQYGEQDAALFELPADPKPGH
jgi:hypothetical protein